MVQAERMDVPRDTNFVRWMILGAAKRPASEARLAIVMAYAREVWHRGMAKKIVIADDVLEGKRIVNCRGAIVDPEEGKGTIIDTVRDPVAFFRMTLRGPATRVTCLG